MSDPFHELFEGLDAEREVPAELDAALEHLLTTDAATSLAATGTDGPRPVPRNLADRITRSLTGASAPSGAAAAGAGRLRLIRGGQMPPTLLRAAAVAVAVLLIAGTAAIASEMSGRGGAPAEIDQVVAPPPPTTAPQPAAPVETTTTTTTPAPAPAADLVALSSCEELLGHFQSRALEYAAVGVSWREVGYGYGVGGGDSEAVAADGASSSGSQGGSAAGSPPMSSPPASGTNNQEAGVDEPDIVKTEAARVFAIARDDRGPVIRALRPQPGGATLAGTFDLPPEAHGADLLLSGDRLLALASAWDPASHVEVTKVWVLDVSDLNRLRLTDVVSVEGSYSTARLANGRVRLVITSGALGPKAAHSSDPSPEAQSRARAENEEAVRGSTLDDWVPNYTHEHFGADGKSTTESGRACACDSTLRPAEFSGFGSVTVLTIDPQDPKPDNAAAVTGAAHITYASPSDLFVSTVEVPDAAAMSSSRTASSPSLQRPHETRLHQFSITQPEARYLASGKVPGALLNQFSMSQHEGHLRVATTLHDSQREGGIDNVVSVLRRDGDELEVTGWVAGLGAPQERIFGVRMVGDTGYVVTFRQIDPLYVLDLSNAAKPRVVGELKIPGVSTYLHPMDARTLLGIGAEATEEGRRTGLGVSVFDVSNRAAPRRAAHLELGPGHSDAEHDHHAFLYWAQTGTLVVPYVEFTHDEDVERIEMSAVVMQATPTSITERGRVSHLGRAGAEADRAHSGAPPAIQRSAVIGNDLWTFSPSGVLVSDLGTLEDRSWLGYHAS